MVRWLKQIFILTPYCVLKILALDIAVKFVDAVNATSGLGEPGLPPVATALANAIYAPTGKHIRKIPFAGQL